MTNKESRRLTIETRDPEEEGQVILGMTILGFTLGVWVSFFAACASVLAQS